jgi:hypothetical protein
MAFGITGFTLTSSTTAVSPNSSGITWTAYRGNATNCQTTASGYPRALTLEDPLLIIRKAPTLRRASSIRNAVSNTFVALFHLAARSQLLLLQFRLPIACPRPQTSPLRGSFCPSPILLLPLVVTMSASGGTRRTSRPPNTVHQLTIDWTLGPCRPTFETGILYHFLWLKLAARRSSAPPSLAVALSKPRPLENEVTVLGHVHELTRNQRMRKVTQPQCSKSTEVAFDPFMSSIGRSKVPFSLH